MNKPVVGYAWYSRAMARRGWVVLYRTPAGGTVRCTLVDTWRGGRRLARWRDMRYVGRVLLGNWRKEVAGGAQV